MQPAVHSGLMPATLITLAHFSVSSAMSLVKSGGEPASTAKTCGRRNAIPFYRGTVQA